MSFLFPSKALSLWEETATAIALGLVDGMFLLCLTQPCYQGTRSVGFFGAFFPSFFLRFFSFSYLFNSLILSKGDLSCRHLGCARFGQGVQESRGRSWIDRYVGYLHTTGPVGAAIREKVAQAVLFILYIIVVVELT